MAKKTNEFSNGIFVANKTNGWQIKRTCGKKNEGKKNAPPCNKRLDFEVSDLFMTSSEEIMTSEIRWLKLFKHFFQPIALFQRKICSPLMMTSQKFLKNFTLLSVLRRPCHAFWSHRHFRAGTFHDFAGLFAFSTKFSFQYPPQLSSPNPSRRRGWKNFHGNWWFRFEVSIGQWYKVQYEMG